MFEMSVRTLKRDIEFMKDSLKMPIEFDVPTAATLSGELNLSWYREAGLGGNGRGCQVSEVWLLRK